MLSKCSTPSSHVTRNIDFLSSPISAHLYPVSQQRPVDELAPVPSLIAIVPPAQHPPLLANITMCFIFCSVPFVIHFWTSTRVLEESWATRCISESRQEAFPASLPEPPHSHHTESLYRLLDCLSMKGREDWPYLFLHYCFFHKPCRWSTMAWRGESSLTAKVRGPTTPCGSWRNTEEATKRSEVTGYDVAARSHDWRIRFAIWLHTFNTLHHWL